jgi:glutathione S-transferase
MPSLVLYGYHESGHSYKVAFALQLASIEYEYRWIDIMSPRDARREDFRAASKFGEVPVLVAGGRPMAQSNAILLYIAQQYRCLGGETAEGLSSAREWLFWEANRIGISLANLRSLIRFEKNSPPLVLDWLRARFERDVSGLDIELSTRPFLLGDAVSIVDVSCCAYLFLADEAGVDLRPWRAVTRWLDRIQRLPQWTHPNDLLKKPGALATSS